jgi:oligosaccharide repeat unit polymerase
MGRTGRHGGAAIRRQVQFPLPALALSMAGVAGIGVAWVAPDQVFGAITLAAIVSGGLLLASHKADQDIFGPLVFVAVAYCLLFCIRPLATEYVWGASSSESLGYRIGPSLAEAIFVATCGVAALGSGYLSVRRRPGPARLKSTLDIPPGFGVLTAHAVVVSSALLLLFLRQSGGAPVLWGGRSVEVARQFQGASGYLYAAPQMLLPFGLYLLAFRTLSSGWRLLGCGLILFSQIAQVGPGNRSYLIPAAISVFMVLYMRTDRRPRLRTVAISLVVLMAIGITLPREQRVADPSYTSVSAFDIGEGTKEFLVGLDTAMVDNLALVVEERDSDLPYRWGATYIAALARPIPSALWPGKPPAADQELNEVLFPWHYQRHIGFSYSFFAEPYYNFGITGVITVSFLMGVLLRRFWIWYGRSRLDPYRIAIIALTIPYIIVYARGGLGVDYHRQAIATIPFLVAFAILSRVSPSPGRRRMTP